jgi:hypothetical protein
MNIRLFSVIIAGMLSVCVLPCGSIAKPSSDENKLGNGVKFTFEGCTQLPSQEKVIYTGVLRSFDGEKRIGVRRDQTTITDTKGKTYTANRLTIGDDFNCKVTYCHGAITLVENVEYKSTFIFTDISTPLSKLPLVSIGFARQLKYRNISVRNSEDVSNEQNQGSDEPTKSLTNTPK